MVQKYQSPVRVYKYPFELVMKAYERRFPCCPQIPIVAHCDIISETYSPDNSLRVTERRCKLHVDAPYLLKKIIGVDFIYFIQKNSLNLRNRTLDIKAYNESFQSRVVVNETCRYFVHPENNEWTCFEQCAELDIKSFFGFENTIEKLAMKQFSQNIARGKEVLEHFIVELKTEGITHVPKWLPSPDAISNEDTNDNNEATVSPEMVTLCTKPRRNSGQQTSKVYCTTLTCLECQSQIDSEYIQRYLGHLTLIQESRLVQLRKSFAQLHKGKVPNDTMLLRFLRARDFNVDKARHLLSESLSWRKKHGVDKVLSEYVTPQIVKDYFPGGWHHHDKDGRPVYLLRLGQMDVKGLLKTIGEDGLLKLTLHVCEEGLRLTEEATLSWGKPISTWCLLVDLEGLNMRHLWRPGIKALLHIIEIVEANYPETLGRVLIIRAPRVFPIMWALVSTFIDDITRTKFLLYGGNDYQEPGGLVDYIPEEYIPDFLGGPCKTVVQDVSLIPKSMYLTEGELCKEGHHMTDDSIYHSVSITKSQTHDVSINITDIGSVITWDFDIMKEDVSFSVCRSNKLSTSDTDTTTNHDANPSPVEEIERVEGPVTCRDGESVQGSHVCSKPGRYILSWKHIGDHKATLMYFYEILSSSDYKGSMSSLQSGNSSFSALSTSCPATSR
ncbi:SEC14-like protein 1 [Cimex lectularius]|uniref:Protein real-time n=1 Tax=Cimex lectularius TaxID=79782 RepID=A0A8I6RL64_CIMLE|nr:SEC14-like protein 1 [Cimex lectularius]